MVTTRVAVDADQEFIVVNRFKHRVPGEPRRPKVVATADFTPDFCSTNSDLLDRMGQFMCEQLFTALRSRLVLSFGKDDIASRCVGQRPNRAGGLACRSIRMNPQVAEVLSEARLEISARGRV